MTNSSNIYVSGSETKNVIQASNNRSRYYAELAKKYKDEAKELRDSAQYYAEQNSDVTKAYVDEINVTLRNLIATKQDSGNYALSSEIPTKVSDLTNDSSFMSSTDVGNAISAQALLTTAEISTSASAKANKDCDNLSATGKTTVVTLAHELDLSNTVTVASANTTSGTYTPTSDGVFYVYACCSGGSAAKSCYANISFSAYDGTDSICGGWDTGSGTYYIQSGWLPVLKNITVYYRSYATGGTYNYVHAKFIPYKKA